MNKPFDNESRNRYYGIRKGDIVVCSTNGCQGQVVEYGFMDNNAVWVLVSGREKPIKYVAEWLDIVTKIEDQ